MEANLQLELNLASYCFAQSDAAKAFTDFAQRTTKSPVSNSLSNGDTQGLNKYWKGRACEPRPDFPILSSTLSTHGPPTNALVSSLSEASIQRTKPRDINTALHFAIDSFPDRPFLRFGGKDATYGQFGVSVSKLAGGLQDAGITSGDRVMVMMRNSMEMVEVWMAVNRLGAVWVPINVELKSITLKHVVSAANPQLIIADSEFAEQIAALGVPCDVYLNSNASVSRLQDLYTRGSEATTSHAVDPSTTAAFLYTSGTTGKSKPCMLSHEYFILQAQALIDGCGLQQDDVLYCPFPLFHADATALTTIPAVLLGATAALSVRFSVSRFWEEIRSTQATVYDFMGATLAMLYKQPPDSLDCQHKVRLAWGVPIPAWAPAYEARFGHKLITLYGSVEASLPIFQQGLLPAGSCGKVRKGHQVRIANEADEELPPNTPGHLLLRSDFPNAFFQGYFNDPENTAAALANLWLHTGDLAKVDDSGNVYFLGRVKDTVRRRGENVNAAEVEEEFLQHPDVLMAAAYGIPSQLGSGAEEDLKVAIQVRDPASGARGVDESALWEWACEYMARFQVPSVIEIVPEIRKTPTGKIEKHGLTIDGGVRFDVRST